MASHLQITSPLRETATSCGNVLRGTITVSGKEYTAEARLDRSALWIIDPDSSLQDSFAWDPEAATFIADSLNGVTDNWPDHAIDAIDTIAPH